MQNNQIIALVAAAIIILILVSWWVVQPSGPVKTNDTSPAEPNITPSLPNEPNITARPNITPSSPSLSNVSDGIMVTTGNALVFLCPKGWALGTERYEKIGSYNTSSLRCFKDDESFVIAYSVLDPGEGPNLQEVMAVTMERVQNAGGRGFKFDTQSWEYTYSLNSVDRRGFTTFTSCAGMQSIVQIELPSSEYGSQITPIIHSINCKLI